MANPLSAASAVEFSSKSNITNLQYGEAKPLGDVDCSAAVYFDAEVGPIRFKTVASGGWAAGDTCSLYLIHTLTSLTTAAEWTDSIDPDSATDISSSILSATLVQTIEVDTDNQTYHFEGFSVRDVLGFVPFGWTVIVANGGTSNTADFSNTAGDHFAKYRLISYA